MRNIDWSTLKTEFITNQTHKEARSWLREVKGWKKSNLDSGNTKARTVGWSAKRAQMQHQLFIESLATLKETHKQKLIDMFATKHLLIDKLNAHAKKTTSLNEIVICFKIVQTELESYDDTSSDTGKRADDTLSSVRTLIEKVNKQSTLSSNLSN